MNAPADLSPAARELTAARRAVALALGPVKKLEALQAGARSLAIPVRHGFIERQVVIDGLHEQAENCGLRDDPGDEAVAIAIQTGLEAFDADGGTIDDGASAEVAEILPLITVAPTSWSGPVPDQQWIAHHRIPRGDVTLFAGDGDAGKTLAMLQLNANVARGALDWLGAVIDAGPTLFVSGEEPEVEIRRRLARIATAENFALSDLSRLHLHFPPPDAPAMAVRAPDGGLKRTPFFHQLVATIADIRPVLLTVDSVAAFYGGEQNQRSHVRTFVGFFKRLAQSFDMAVVLIDHPSLSGIVNKTGRGGNMDWSNSVRSRLYLTRDLDGSDDTDLRELKVMKANYSARGAVTRLRWSDGRFIVEGGDNPLERAAGDDKAEAVFIRLLLERNTQGRHVSSKKGPGYAPKVLAEMPNAEGFTPKALTAAMERLFVAGRLLDAEYGPPSKRRSQLIVRPSPSNRLPTE